MGQTNTDHISGSSLTFINFTRINQELRHDPEFDNSSIFCFSHVPWSGWAVLCRSECPGTPPVPPHSLVTALPEEAGAAQYSQSERAEDVLLDVRGYKI